MTLVSTPSPEGHPFTDPAPSGPALLSLEASLQARSLRAWSAEARTTLAARVQGVLQGWERAYGLEPSSLDPNQRLVRCEPPQPPGGRASSWTPFGTSGLWWALLGWGQETPHTLLLKALFDEASPASETTRIADEVARAAWDDWQQRLLGALQPAATPGTAEAQLQPWSGALVLTLPWCGRELLLLVSQGCAAANLPRPAVTVGALSPLVPTAKAILPLGLPLRVELKALETDLGTLTSLRVGDVLRTSHALEAALLVRSAVGAAAEPEGLCHGFLGQQGAHRAVELLRHPSSRS